MQKKRVWFGVLFIALPFAFIACGDDSEDDGGGNTGGKGGTAGSATGGKGGTSTGGKGGSSTGGSSTGGSSTGGSSTGGKGGTATGGTAGEGGMPEGGEGGQPEGGTGGTPMGGMGGAMAGGGAGGKAGGGSGGALSGGGAGAGGKAGGGAGGSTAGGGAGGSTAGGGAGGKAGGGAGGATAGGGAGGTTGGAGMAGGGGSGGVVATCDPTAPPETYVGVLDGAQEVPPVTTTATGVVIAQLNAAATELTSSVYWSGLTSNTTIGHIHGPAAAGVGPAAAIFDYMPPAGATSGQVVAKTFSINATQLGYLRTAMLYANIHSANNGGGEIRAQLLPATLIRSGTLSAAQETTAVTSTATGRAVVVVLPNSTQAFVSVNWTGLTGTVTWLAHIHGPAAAGATASPMLDLFDGATAPVSNQNSGSIVQKLYPITAPQLTAITNNLSYANVHSDMYRGGEIRAQLLPRCN